MSTPKKKTIFPIRAVHLDLKGLVPTYFHLLELLELFASASYNAVLIEWEDMFPWSVDRQFRSRVAYSTSQIHGICEKASSLGIQTIPLVQSFGHMETFLKPEKYAYLREQCDRTDSLNPLADGACQFVIELIQDVLELMPDVSYFHVGADEVWTLGCNPSSLSFVNDNGEARLFLHHMKPILKYLCDRNVRPIIWHDMLTKWEPDSLSEISELTDVMVWDYSKPSRCQKHLSQLNHVCDFKKSGIDLWGATAFKGADGQSSDLPSLENRCKNALAWYENANRIEFKGVVATGWNRYSTDQMQCEPIDIALDSLVSVGYILYNGSPGDYTKTLMETNNMEVFSNCSSVLRDFSDRRTECWSNVQLLYELYALAQLDPSKRGSGKIEKKFAQFVVNLDELKTISETVVKTFRGLIEQTCLGMFVSERITAIENAKEHLVHQMAEDRIMKLSVITDIGQENRADIGRRLLRSAT